VKHVYSPETLPGCSTAGPPQPFVYTTLGMMGSLGHGKAFGQMLGVRVRGFLAWFMRRTYYLLQMPGLRRRLRIMIDWTFALLFRPDVAKIDLDSEEDVLLRKSTGSELIGADHKR
jgi:NADH dehydrogenase